MALPPKTIMLGNPPTPGHQPNPQEISDWMESQADGVFSSLNNSFGNAIGRGDFLDTDYNPFRDAVDDLGTASVVDVTGHPNGATKALRVSAVSVLSDYRMKCGDIRGQTFRARGVVDNTSGLFEARIGLYLRDVNNVETEHFVIAATAGQGPQVFDGYFTIPDSLDLPKDCRIMLRCTVGGFNDWSSLWIEPSRPRTTVSTSLPSGGADGDLWLRVSP